MSEPTQPTPLARLPSVDRLLTSAAAASLIERHGRHAVTRVLRMTLDGLRGAIRRGEDVAHDPTTILTTAAAALAHQAAPSLRPVFNLTGTILHSNLGRAALPEAAIAAVVEVARGASNLEYDLAAGHRGDRDSHLVQQICGLTGAEAATVVNNNAAAVMLVLNTLAIGREVPVSRGELVEIGGSFRIPDIMARSGARLVEVGTTNRTHLRDFERAIGPDTAMVMKVHTSNYVISGFTAAVPEAALAQLCRARAVPFVNDLGSGTLVDLERYGLPHEPTPMDALRHGADVVTFSGDKLLGGPQAGIIVGRKDLITQIKANPMKRALRCDKMTIAALSAVLRLYADPDRLGERLPGLRALTRTLPELRETAHRLQAALQARLGTAAVKVIDCDSVIGSGALPTRQLKSVGLAIRLSRGGNGKAENAAQNGGALCALAAAFRGLPVPVIGRIHDGQLVLDLRCLDDEAAFVAQLAQLERLTS